MKSDFGEKEKKKKAFLNDTDLSLRKLNKLQKSVLEIQNK